MSAAPKPSALLPPDARRDRPLLLVIAILVFLASLSALGARKAWVAADTWTGDLSAQATIQILSGETQDADGRAEAAAELIRGLPGVNSAEPLDSETASALLEPWFGDALPADLPAPRLIAVTGDVSAETMQSALDEAGFDAIVDDHSRWESEIIQATAIARLGALAVVSLIAIAAAAVIAFATRAGLAARRDVINALRIAGARDGLIARLFMRRFFLMALKAGLLGGVLAAIAAYGLSFALNGLSLWADGARPGIIELAILTAAPLGAGLIGALSAYMAVLDAMRAMD